ncbi:MAG: hypothetical protein MI924_37815 [Chloroflexales bacterium]|nr:hypothetical protein [Chloroflexales bacterium]
MNGLFANRLLRSYLVLLLGILVFIGRRYIIPTTLELEGLPPTIAVGSVLNSCYVAPTWIKCSDPVIIAVSVLLMTLTLGWGNWVAMMFAVILAILPLAIYFLLGPITLVLINLLAIPLIVQLILRLIFPPGAQKEEES